MARASAAQWAKRVERWKDSGLTAKEFAAETGVNASTLSYWRWKLGAEAREEQKAAGGRKRSAATKRSRGAARSQRQSATPSLVEVPVAAVVTAPDPVELVLGDVRVRVPVGFDEATLTRVVRAVGAAR